jgi:NAD(P)-dependent dehydrogenase (short-subunit alcohol dehydrogenase family)
VPILSDGGTTNRCRCGEKSNIIKDLCPFMSLTVHTCHTPIELLTVQKALTLMPDGGAIVLNASIVASKGPVEWGVYSATKAAVRSFARTWAAELNGRRIRVNAVSAGYTETSGLGGLLDASGEGEQKRRAIALAVPLGRFGTPDEIAKAVLFLASDDSSYVTGTELFVDGGVAQV